MYVGLFVPTFVQLTFHWYKGPPPPFVAVAVKVTGVPKQQGLMEAAMVMEAGNTGFTVMVMALEVTGFDEAQLRLEVSKQVTISPFAGI